MLALLLLACVSEHFVALGGGEVELILTPRKSTIEPVHWVLPAAPLPEDASSWFESGGEPGEARAVLREERVYGVHEWFGGGDQRSFTLSLQDEDAGGAELFVVFEPDQPGDPVLFGEFTMSEEQGENWISIREDVDDEPLENSGIPDIDPYLPAQGDVRFEVVDTGTNTTAELSLSWELPDYVETVLR